MGPFEAEHHRYFTDASPIRPYFQETFLVRRCARSPGRYNAHIMGRAVMFPILPGAALRFSFALAPSLSVARDRRWCDHDYPRWGGHTSTTLQLLPCSAHRLLS